VKILDEVLEKTEKAKENAEKNLQNVKDLFESYLQSVFAKPSDEWERCSIEKYIHFIDYRGRTPKKTFEGVRLITAKNIKMGFLQKHPEEFIDPRDYKSWMTRGIPRKGDVLFTTEAPLAMVAQLDTAEKVAFAQRTIIFQTDSEKLDATFLKYLLMSMPIQEKIIQKGTGATVKGIKASLLKKIEIYFPKSLFDQKSIVKKLDALSAETKKLEAIYKQKLADLEELKKSVLKKAFSGGL
jgi:type I restriction enzyme S subunit